MTTEDMVMCAFVLAASLAWYCCCVRRCGRRLADQKEDLTSVNMGLRSFLHDGAVKKR